MHRSSDDSDDSPLHGSPHGPVRRQPGEAAATLERPGSAGEHELQQACGTRDRANRFYNQQMNDRLNAQMREFIGRMEMMFIATSDAHGECDASFRAGPPGFALVLDERTLAWPEYRGNGVMASAGNVLDNPHVGLLFIDFVRDLIGLHVNGSASLLASSDFALRYPADQVDIVPGRRPERWIVVTVEEAYIHCSKHIPRLAPLPRTRDWGTDDPEKKGGDYFRVAADRRAAAAATNALPTPAP
jgi:predicted pyridoxine 5'-phosphate oxidase superfamily flavin-nucleotide-binding protein